MSPFTSVRRSFVSRRLPEAVLAVATEDRKRATGGDELKLTLVDLSLLPRWGLKGCETFAFLETQGAISPSKNNKAEPQRDGSLIARLSPTEALILSSLQDGRSTVGQTIETIPLEGRGSCYPLPKQDSHCWFIVAGSDGPRLFAKLCGVNLAPDQFANWALAQTSVARVSAIVIRHDIGKTISFSLLTESPSAEYLWDCLIDAMKEFSGAICGIEGLTGSGSASREDHR